MGSRSIPKYRVHDCDQQAEEPLRALWNLGTIISGRGPQYASHGLPKFCKSWDIIHVSNIPYKSKANGKAESAIKTCKRIMRKPKDACSDPYLAILAYRDTPSQGFLSNTATRLMSTRTKTLLPTASVLLRPDVVDARHTEPDMMRSQNQQAIRITTSVLPTYKSWKKVTLIAYNPSD